MSLQPSDIGLNFFGYVLAMASISGHTTQQAATLRTLNTGLCHPIFNYICNVEDDADSFQQALEKFQAERSPFYFCNGGFNEGKATSVLAGTFGIGPCFPLDGMAYDLKKDLPEVKTAVPWDVQVVTTQDQLVSWIEVSAAVNGHTVEQGRTFFRTWETDQVTLVLASVGGKPVGCAMLYLDPVGYAGNYWASVLPNFRKQGVNSLMVRKRLELACDRGFSHVVAQCMDSSTRLYQKLGFENVGELEFYAVMDGDAGGVSSRHS